MSLASRQTALGDPAESRLVAEWFRRGVSFAPAADPKWALDALSRFANRIRDVRRVYDLRRVMPDFVAVMNGRLVYVDCKAGHWVEFELLGEQAALAVPTVYVCPAESGDPHRWHVVENPVRHGKIPANLVPAKSDLGSGDLGWRWDEGDLMPIHLFGDCWPAGGAR